MAAGATIADTAQLRRTDYIPARYPANAGWLVFTTLMVFIIEGLVIALRFLNVAVVSSHISIVLIAVRLHVRVLVYCIDFCVYKIVCAWEITFNDPLLPLRVNKKAAWDSKITLTAGYYIIIIAHVHTCITCHWQFTLGNV